jgi:integrase
MKAHREHRVPLSARAIAILQDMSAGRLGDYVFAGNRAGMPLSNMALLALLKRIGYSHITVHGFRSTFRDGRQNSQAILGMCAKWRWRMQSRTQPKPRTGAAIFLRSVAS